MLMAGCDGGFVLIVQARTDLVPSEEFIRVRTEVVRVEGSGGELVDMVASSSDDFLEAVHVAELSGLAGGDYRVRVELIDRSGRTVLQRITLVRVDANMVATMVLTRDCRGVTCDLGGEQALACLGGECMDARCTEETDELCEPECTVAADCAPLGPCAAAQCNHGFCLYGAPPGACASGEWCEPNLGCLPLGSSSAPCEPGANICPYGQTCCPEGGAASCQELLPGCPCSDPSCTLGAACNVTTDCQESEACCNDPMTTRNGCAEPTIGCECNIDSDCAGGQGCCEDAETEIRACTESRLGCVCVIDSNCQTGQTCCTDPPTGLGVCTEASLGCGCNVGADCNAGQVCCNDGESARGVCTVTSTDCVCQLDNQCLGDERCCPGAAGEPNACRVGPC